MSGKRNSDAARPGITHGTTIGVDLGGTKIEAIALDSDGVTTAKIRIPTPRQNYAATVAAIADLVAQISQVADLTDPVPVGIAIPGSLSPSTGLVQNANSTWLNGQPFAADLQAALARPVRLANDANCFALSEFEDGAGRNARILFGVILGTGCGGGIVIDGSLVDGRRAIGGEWGHNPLPWPTIDEVPGPQCWCGRSGCLETWLSGPAISADHMRQSGESLATEDIARRALIPGVSGDASRATLQRHVSRLARGLAHVVNLIDPDVVVLGGGLSQLAHIYAKLPDLIAPYIFADDVALEVRPPQHGDASGARGAARLWRQPQRR